MIKLIACDVDGTLLEKGKKTLADGTLELIKSATDKGVIFAVASGRPYEDMKKLFRTVVGKLVFICHDGALIIHNNTVLHKGVIQRRVVLDFCETAKIIGNTDVYASFREHSVKIIGKDATDFATLGEEVIKLSFYSKNGTAALIDGIGNIHGSGLRISYFNGDWVEVIEKHCNKGEALSIVQRCFGVSTAQTAAFGNGDNDVPMLRKAGLKFATSDAAAALLDEAEFITDNIFEEIEKIT